MEHLDERACLVGKYDSKVDAPSLGSHLARCSYRSVKYWTTYDSIADGAATRLVRLTWPLSGHT